MARIGFEGPCVHNFFEFIVEIREFLCILGQLKLKATLSVLIIVFTAVAYREVGQLQCKH